MVKPGLQAELRLAFQKAKQAGTVRKENLIIERNGGLKSVDFEIIPVKAGAGTERYYLIAFEEHDRRRDDVREPQKTNPVGKRGKKKKTKSARESDYDKVKDELEATREYLQSIIEEQRTTNEELRSANGEIQSSNEELQSINEELETAKEELQSSNEELTTMNEELHNRNDELSHVNNDLNNLLSSVNIPIVMLGNDLRLRRFTPMAEKVMNLIPGDIGRPITDIKPNLKIADFRQMIGKVVDTLEIHESEVEDQTGKRYLMRIRPYRTVDNKIDGVVVVWLDLEATSRRANQ